MNGGRLWRAGASLALALTATAAPAADRAAGAPGQAVTFQGDVAHTGFVSERGLNPPLRRAWVSRFPSEISYPVIAEGKVFVTAFERSRDGYDRASHLVALSTRDGRVLWRRQLSDHGAAVPAYADGRVFVSVGDIGEHGGGLHAFAAGDGAHLWHVPYQTSANAPVAEGGAVYVSGAPGGYGAYRTEDGGLLWRGSTDDAGAGAPALSADTVYFTFACPNVYAVNRADGALRWHPPTTCHGGGGSTPVLHGGRLYVREDDEYPPGDIYDAATGNVLGDMRADYPPVFAGGVGVFPDARTPRGEDFRGHTLVARSVSDGRVRWRFRGDGYLDSAPLIVNRTVYVASGSGRLYGLSLRSGRVVSRGRLGGPVPAPVEPGGILSGLGAGEGLLVVPAGRRLVAYR